MRRFRIPSFANFRIPSPQNAEIESPSNLTAGKTVVENAQPDQTAPLDQVEGRGESMSDTCIDERYADVSSVFDASASDMSSMLAQPANYETDTLRSGKRSVEDRFEVPAITVMRETKAPMHSSSVLFSPLRLSSNGKPDATIREVESCNTRSLTTESLAPPTITLLASEEYSSEDVCTNVIDSPVSRPLLHPSSRPVALTDRLAEGSSSDNDSSGSAANNLLCSASGRPEQKRPESMKLEGADETLHLCLANGLWVFRIVLFSGFGAVQSLMTVGARAFLYLFLLINQRCKGQHDTKPDLTTARSNSGLCTRADVDVASQNVCASSGDEPVGVGIVNVAESAVNDLPDRLRHHGVMKHTSEQAERDIEPVPVPLSELDERYSRQPRSDAKLAVSRRPNSNEQHLSCNASCSEVMCGARRKSHQALRKSPSVPARQYSQDFDPRGMQLRHLCSEVVLSPLKATSADTNGFIESKGSAIRVLRSSQSVDRNRRRPAMSTELPSQDPPAMVRKSSDIWKNKRSSKLEKSKALPFVNDMKNIKDSFRRVFGRHQKNHETRIESPLCASNTLTLLADVLVKEFDCMVAVRKGGDLKLRSEKPFSRERRLRVRVTLRHINEDSSSIIVARSRADEHTVNAEDYDAFIAELQRSFLAIANSSRM